MHKVRHLREEKNISSKTMTEILGMSKGNYSKKELGNLRFSLEEAKVIADFFEMTIEDIFFSDKLSKMENIQI